MRRRLKTSQHEMTKSRDLMATVNDAVVQGKFVFLSGEICLTGDRPFSSEALDDQALALPESIIWQRANLMETDSAAVGNHLSD